jgi:hypothetical protein
MLSTSLIRFASEYNKHRAERSCGCAGAGPILALATERPPAPQARLRARAGLAGQHALLLAHLQVLLLLHQACSRLTLSRKGKNTMELSLSQSRCHHEASGHGRHLTMCAPSSASGSRHGSAPAQTLQVHSHSMMTGHHTQRILKPPVWLPGSTVDRTTCYARTKLDVEQGRIVHLLHTLHKQVRLGRRQLLATNQMQGERWLDLPPTNLGVCGHCILHLHAPTTTCQYGNKPSNACMAGVHAHHWQTLTRTMGMLRQTPSLHTEWVSFAGTQHSGQNARQIGCSTGTCWRQYLSCMQRGPWRQQLTVTSSRHTGSAHRIAHSCVSGELLVMCITAPTPFNVSRCYHVEQAG